MIGESVVSGVESAPDVVRDSAFRRNVETVLTSPRANLGGRGRWSGECFHHRLRALVQPPFVQCGAQPAVGPLLREFAVVAEDDRYVREPDLGLGERFGQSTNWDLFSLARSRTRSMAPPRLVTDRTGWRSRISGVSGHSAAR